MVFTNLFYIKSLKYVALEELDALSKYNLVRNLQHVTLVLSDFIILITWGWWGWRKIDEVTLQDLGQLTLDAALAGVSLCQRIERSCVKSQRQPSKETNK